MNARITNPPVAASFELRGADGVLVLELRGELGSLGWDPQFDGLEDAVRSALRKLQHARMVVDVSTVTFGGSEFLQFLVGLNKRVRAYGGQVVLAGASGQLAQLLHITKLDRVLAQRGTLEAAIGAVRASAPANRAACSDEKRTQIVCGP